MIIVSLISFLSIILVTGSPFKSYTNFFGNNNHILLNITPIYAQDNGGDFEDGNIFPGFEEDGGDGDGIGKEEDGGDGDGIGKEEDGGDGGDGDGIEVGNEERISEILMILAPYPLTH